MVLFHNSPNDTRWQRFVSIFYGFRLEIFSFTDNIIILQIFSIVHRKAHDSNVLYHLTRWFLVVFFFSVHIATIPFMFHSNSCHIWYSCTWFHHFFSSYHDWKCSSWIKILHSEFSMVVTLTVYILKLTMFVISIFKLGKCFCVSTISITSKLKWMQPKYNVMI